MILGLHHVGVATHDLDRLSLFYTELFGGKIINELSWDETEDSISLRLGLKISSGRLAMVEFDGARIEIFEFTLPTIPKASKLRSVAKPGFSHICFKVVDCKFEYDRLIARGMIFHAAPKIMPSGGVFTYGRDPDGNVVELLQLPIKQL